MTDLDRLKYETLLRQLERMRGMQYAYHRKFFALLLVSTLAAGACLVVSRGPALVFLCFGLVSTGVSAAFLLHFCDFARIHARALEERINRLAGEHLLVASQLEADYFYPLDGSRFSPAIVFSGRFFDLYTAHFCILWALMIGAAGFQIRQGVSPRAFAILAGIWGLWTLANLGFVLAWFRGAAGRRMAQTLRERLGTPCG